MSISVGITGLSFFLPATHWKADAKVRQNHEKENFQVESLSSSSSFLYFCSVIQRKMTKYLMLGMLLFPQNIAAQHYKVKSVAWERLEVTNQLDKTPDERALRMVEPYKKSVDSIMAPVLGMSRVAMAAKRPESLLGNWAADVLVEGSNATGLPTADMGLVNVGGLRNSMPKGVVRRGDIILISPFENKLVVLEMKGTDLMELMRNIASVKGEGVSKEVRMVITPDGELKDVTIHGEPISAQRIYRIATIDYLAEGNDKMTALKRAEKRHDLKMLIRDVMMESIIKNRIIDSQIEGRIVIEK